MLNIREFSLFLASSMAEKSAYDKLKAPINRAIIIHKIQTSDSFVSYHDNKRFSLTASQYRVALWGTQVCARQRR